MTRANKTRNLLRAISAATFGAIMLVTMLSAGNNAAACFTIGAGCFGYGFWGIISSTQSVEITPDEMIHQTAVNITRVRWDEIGSFVLDANRFRALSKHHSEILLDIDLHAHDQAGWPCAERAQFAAQIERKMQEIGAARKTAP